MLGILVWTTLYFTLNTHVSFAIVYINTRIHFIGADAHSMRAAHPKLQTGKQHHFEIDQSTVGK